MEWYHYAAIAGVILNGVCLTGFYALCRYNASAWFEEPVSKGPRLRELYSVTVAKDPDYLDYLTRDQIKDIHAGELQAYTIQLNFSKEDEQRGVPRYGFAFSYGVIATPGHDGIYPTMAALSDENADLTRVAWDMLTNVSREMLDLI